MKITITETFGKDSTGQPYEAVNVVVEGDSTEPVADAFNRVKEKVKPKEDKE